MSFYNKKIETASKDEIAALQLTKLQKMLHVIYGANTFYTNKLKASDVHPDDIKSIKDLTLLPMTTKKELMNDQEINPSYRYGNLTYSLENYVRFHQTSGTTGVPLHVLDTQESWDWWGECWAHVLAGAGVTKHDRIFMAFAFGPFIAFWGAVEGAKRIGAMMIPGGGRDSAQRLELIRDSGATVLCSTPSYALRLAEVAKERNLPIRDFQVRTTIHAGEPGANIVTTKRRIEEAWNAKCFDHAGASEVGAHSFECLAQSGANHIIESEFIAEVVDNNGQPVPDGKRGELIITNLGRIGFPIIRYHTGDIVQRNHTPCACGRSFAKLEGGILGRADDMFTVRGVNIFPSAVENILRRFKQVSEFKVTVSKQNEMDELFIEVEPFPGANPQLKFDILSAFESAIGLKPVINIMPSGSLPRFETKAKRFHVKKSA